MATQFRGIVPILRMFDIGKAKDFYLGFLDFKLDWEHRFAPDLPLYMQVSLGEVRLHLSEHYGDCAPGAKIMIETVGLADYHAALAAKLYGYARPGLVEEPWGATTMTISDPFFNKLAFTENRPQTVTA